jgi:lipopolysaccharide transport system ATP-binding protein
VTPDADVAVRLDLVSKRYVSTEVSHAPGAVRGTRTVDALDRVSLTVRRGEALALVGPNGAGKTTLLRIVAGVTRPSSGVVAVRGPVVALLGPAAAFHVELSARENVVLAAAFHGVPRRAALASVSRVLDAAGLSDSADIAIKHMSEGMRVRLAVSTALSLRAEVLLHDEALASADAEFRERATALLKARLAAGCALLLASHDAPLVISTTQRAVRLEHGKIVAEGLSKDVLAGAATA